MALVTGTDSGETPTGTSANDFIQGRGGDDIVHAKAGDDRIFDRPHRHGFHPLSRP